MKIYKVITYKRVVSYGFFGVKKEEWVEDMVEHVLPENLKNYLDREIHFGAHHFSISEIVTGSLSPRVTDD